MSGFIIDVTKRDVVNPKLTEQARAVQTVCALHMCLDYSISYLFNDLALECLITQYAQVTLLTVCNPVDHAVDHFCRMPKSTKHVGVQRTYEKALLKI